MRSNRWDLPALDGLRALAILLVICCHMAYFVGPVLGNNLDWGHTLYTFGFTGVFLFFVLSAFPMCIPRTCHRARSGQCLENGPPVSALGCSWWRCCAGPRGCKGCSLCCRYVTSE
jgi:hypothetical protein